MKLDIEQQRHFEAVEQLARQIIGESLPSGLKVTEVDYQDHDKGNHISVNVTAVTDDKYLKPYCYSFDVMFNIEDVGLTSITKDDARVMGGIDGDEDFDITSECLLLMMLGHHIGAEV